MSKNIQSYFCATKVHSFKPRLEESSRQNNAQSRPSALRNSVVSNFELLDVRSFPLGKVCVCARSKFENVIFCSNQSQILGNTRRTINVYLMNMFE